MEFPGSPNRKLKSHLQWHRYYTRHGWETFPHTWILVRATPFAHEPDRDYRNPYMWPMTSQEDVLQIERRAEEKDRCHWKILSKWEDIAHGIPHRFEKYSIELLKAVVRLWTTVRMHAFAKGWTMKFEKWYQKGTRKTLQTSLQDNA